MAKVAYLKEFGTKNLAALLDGFKTHLGSTDRARSMSTYLGAVKPFAEWIADRYGEFSPAHVSPLDVVEYRSYFLAQKGRKGKLMSPVTVNKKLVSLRVFYNWLTETGQVKNNPVAGVKQVALAGKPVPKWLTRAQQASLIHAVQGNPKDAAIIEIMLHAGLRVSEVCALTREDIEISERKGLVRIREGKGGKYREVPLNKTVRKVLVDWLDANPEGPLFPNRYGRPIGVQGVEQMVAEYAYQAKVEATPHTLRHYEKRTVM